MKKNLAFERRREERCLRRNARECEEGEGASRRVKKRRERAFSLRDLSSIVMNQRPFDGVFIGFEKNELLYSIAMQQKRATRSGAFYE